MNWKMAEHCVLVFILGLAAGSFLNVCIRCIPEGKPIAVLPFRCIYCGAGLKPTELIPVLSYVLLRGRRKCCGAKISPRYPLVEALTAVIFVMLFSRYALSMDFIASAYLMSVLIAVFFIDLERRIIPDGLVIAGMAGGLALVAYNFVRPVGIYGDRSWWNPLAGAAVGSGFLFLIALAGIIIYKTDEAMGMGDVKIFVPIGIFLGWRMCIMALLLSMLAGGLAGLFLIATGLRDRKSTIPFGPFIALGTFATFMWGWDILNWYLPTIDY